MAIAKSNLTRVSDLAKELHSSPKAILARLEQEGIQNKEGKAYTGFSGVSAGLAMTIREWFADSVPEAGAQADDTGDAATEKSDKPAKGTKAKAAPKTAKAKAPKAAAEAGDEPAAEPPQPPLPSRWPRLPPPPTTTARPRRT